MWSSFDISLQLTSFTHGQSPENFYSAQQIYSSMGPKSEKEKRVGYAADSPKFELMTQTHTHTYCSACCCCCFFVVKLQCQLRYSVWDVCLCIFVLVKYNSYKARTCLAKWCSIIFAFTEKFIEVNIYTWNANVLSFSSLLFSDNNSCDDSSSRSTPLSQFKNFLAFGYISTGFHSLWFPVQKEKNLSDLVARSVNG